VTARLGELERKVMEVLWTDLGAPVSVRHIEEHLPRYAYTTLLTVLTRLHRKGLVRRAKEGRAFLYAAMTSREEYTAELMREALEAVTDRSAVLARFAQSFSPAEAVVLRDVLDGLNDLNANRQTRIRRSR
jgi:predicted transcriptional regulator